MERRQLLKYTAYITGAAVGAPLMATLISGCKADTMTDAVDQLSFFSKDEFTLLKKLIDTIIPKTDSPSATDVGVHNIIDQMVGKVYTSEQQSSYRKGFETLSAHINGGADTLEFLKLLEQDQASGMKDAKEAYLNIKQQAVAYYLSTEEIGTNYLNYLPIPGNYESCISLEEAGGKAWAI